jgi:ribosomal protein S12 methylthiotransferase accessory factor
MDISINFAGGTRVETHIKEHHIMTDQPKSSGGDGTAPAPFDLFLASIATCSGYYVLDFCRERKISTEGIRLVMSTEKDEKTKMIVKITIGIQLPPEFREKYSQKTHPESTDLRGACKDGRLSQEPSQATDRTARRIIQLKSNNRCIHACRLLLSGN